MSMVSDEYSAYMLQLSAGSLTNGVLYEPRGFFDLITLNGTNEVNGHPEVFRNGEDFPIIITHMTAATTYLEQNGATVTPERLIQRVGAYLNFHDQFYMNAPMQLGGGSILRASPLPTWSNVPVGGPECLTRGTSSWRFPRPCILSVRDTLRVSVRLYSPANVDVEGGVPITVSFTGFGLISKQPYFLENTQIITDTGFTQLSVEAFSNDGAEPIALTDMCVQAQAGVLSADPTGDSRRVFVQVRHTGNGSDADWFYGPIEARIPGLGNLEIPTNAIAGINLGTLMGRAVVHEFPRPLVWEPGEGISTTLQAFASGDLLSVNIAMLGYIAIQ